MAYGFIDLPYPDIREPDQAECYEKSVRDNYKRTEPKWHEFRNQWAPILEAVQMHSLGYESVIDLNFKLPPGLAFLYRNHSNGLQRPGDLVRYDICGLDGTVRREGCVPPGKALVLDTMQLHIDTVTDGVEMYPLTASGRHASELRVARFTNFTGMIGSVHLGANPLALGV